MLLMILYLVGALITVAGIALLVKPALVLDFISREANNPVMYGFAIVVRAALGLLMITYAGVSRFPKTVIFFGWVAVIAAVAIAWMGQPRFAGMVKWITGKLSPYSRVGGVFALLFGLFLLYAFL